MKDIHKPEQHIEEKTIELTPAQLREQQDKIKAFGEELNNISWEDIEDLNNQKSDGYSQEDINRKVFGNKITFPTEINEGLKQALEPFKQETWDSMDLSQKKQALIELKDAVLDDLQIDDKPNIEFYKTKDTTDFGYYDDYDDLIYINEYGLNDPIEAADTVAHESRHCWQHRRADLSASERTLQDNAFKLNFAVYFSPERNFRMYNKQLVETDARSYASAITANIER